MLHLHRAERSDPLVRSLATVLAVPLADPFQREIIAVPTRGVERWVIQQLSQRLGVVEGRSDGICANVEFPFPGRLISGVVAVATGVDRDADPWLPERAVWHLLAVVDQCIDEPFLAGLKAHLTPATPEGSGHSRRFATVRHLADLFDRYGVHRPAMIAEWVTGADVGAAGDRLPPDLAWQAELWRRLREHIASPSPAERIDLACQRLREEPELLDLPERLAIFGLTRLPATYLQVLQAVAARRDAHLFLLHPSSVLWERVAALPPESRQTPLSRRSDPTTELPDHPLLATWGRDAREMQLVIGDVGSVDDSHRAIPSPDADTLLARIQADIRADRLPPGPVPLAFDDDSLQVHACHGRARQTEVLRDAILHLLADDPTLEPRDIIVMCPDIDAFSPLIHATFGMGNHSEALRGRVGGAEVGSRAGHGLPALNVRMADRSLRQTNPVLGAIAALFALVGSRATVTEVLDFASLEPVRRRFALDDDDLTRVEEWAAVTGISWGLDAAHRAPYKLSEVGAYTWRWGLDRLLLGVTMAEDGLPLVGEVLPLDDVESGDIALVGRLAELLDRLQIAFDELAGAKPIADWAAAIRHAADLLTATSPADEWQRSQLDRLLADVVDESWSEGEASRVALDLGEMRALLGEALEGRPTRANFRTGHLTVCTLVPMRSVPHRVVCILGLDDGVFPRSTAADGDDLISRMPCVGDRDPRSEDRQLLLDALMAATDHLVITYNGRDERTNAERPPAVPLGELLELVDVMVAGGRSSVVTDHPLQPFDRRNFAPGVLRPDGPWGFDQVALATARSSTGARVDPPQFLAGPLLRAPDDVVELDLLVRFVQHPVKAFLRQRLGVGVGNRESEMSATMPIELDGLQRWAIGQRMLDAILAGCDPGVVAAAELARGQLPPGALGAEVIGTLMAQVRGIGRAADDLTPAGDSRTSVPVAVDLPGGRSLVGVVGDVFGDRLRSVTFSRLAPKHRIASWVRLLAVTAAEPGRRFDAVTVGRGRPGADAAVISDLGDTPQRRQAVAAAHLNVLIDLYDRGRCEPLPLPINTSEAYARAAGHPKAEERAAAEWTTSWNKWGIEKEDREPEHVLVHGGVIEFADLYASPPGPEEAAEGWALDDPSRFGRYARRLWDGLLAHERVEAM